MNYSEKLRKNAQRQNEIEFSLSSDFKMLSRYFNAPQYLYWVSNNLDLLKTALSDFDVHPSSVQDSLTEASRDIMFHFSNFLASIVGCQDFLFAWAGKDEEKLRKLDEYAMQFKYSYSGRVLGALRSSMLHGAILFDNWSIVMKNLNSPESSTVNFSFELTHNIQEKVRSNLCKEHVDAFEQLIHAQEKKEDWLNPLAKKGLEGIALAHQYSTQHFEHIHGSVLARRESLYKEYDNLTKELNEIMPHIVDPFK